MLEEWNLLKKRFKEIAAVLADLAAELKHFGVNSESAQLVEHLVPRDQVFISAGKVHDAYKEIRNRISEAQREAWIEDNYVDNTLFDLLANVGPDVDIKVLTQYFPKDFSLELQKFLQQYSPKMEVRISTTFHDRFIWVDDKCYHLGASIKNAGRKSFLLSQLEDPANVQAVRSNLESDWDAGTVL